MNFEYREVDTIGVDKEQYKILHKALFRSAGADDMWLDWYHKQIPAADDRLSNTRTYGLFDGERLIGIWSVEPKKMVDNNGGLVSVGRCFAVGVSEDYRRMGLFVTLSQYAIESERKRGELEYIVGFPQTGRSVIGGHYKAGWEEIKLVGIYSLDLTQTDGAYCRGDVERVVDFSNVDDSICNCVCFDEPSQYRNVRFGNHPKLQYTSFSYGDAYIVLKQYSTFCHILELSGSKENVKRVIEAAKSVAKRHGLTEMNIWNSSQYVFHNELLQCGFVEGATNGLPITIIAVRINAKDKMEIGAYNFGMAVEEGY